MVIKILRLTLSGIFIVAVLGLSGMMGPSGCSETKAEPSAPAVSQEQKSETNPSILPPVPPPRNEPLEMDVTNPSPNQPIPRTTQPSPPSGIPQ
jgi:hypothetical protein